MAITLAPVRGASYAVSNKKAKVVDVTLDNSYATGGYAITPAQFGLRAIEQISGHGFRKGDNTAHVGFAWDRTNSKLVLFSGGAQVANATDLSTYVGRLTVTGYGIG